MYTVDFLTAGDPPMVIDSASITENYEPVWMDCGLDLMDIQGLEAHEVLPTIEHALANLTVNPGYYLLWSSTGGGPMMEGKGYMDVVDFLEKLRDMSIDYPGAMIAVGY